VNWLRPALYLFGWSMVSVALVFAALIAHAIAFYFEVPFPTGHPGFNLTLILCLCGLIWVAGGWMIIRAERRQ
jgi:hypothetical protein